MKRAFSILLYIFCTIGWVSIAAQSVPVVWEVSAFNGVAVAFAFITAIQVLLSDAIKNDQAGRFFWNWPV